MSNIYSRILVDGKGEILRVTIHRPDDRNSIDTGLMHEVERFLDQAEKTSARAVIFTGAGGTYFIGGADGVEMMQCRPEGARDFSARIQRLFDRMEASPLILVAAINGLCFGGGFEFALACDFRVASEDARIGLPEVKVGLIPGGGGTQRLPRLVGTGRAMEMILSGRLCKGQEARDIGLVHQVVPREALLEEAGKLLEPVLRQPSYAVSCAKRAVHGCGKGPLAEGLEVEREQFGLCFEHDFFVDLMRQQLKDGMLKTTADVSQMIGEGVR
jgi:enoyl-CoA hydratase